MNAAVYFVDPHLEETIEMTDGFIFIDRNTKQFVGSGTTLVEKYRHARVFTRKEAGDLTDLFDEMFFDCDLHVVHGSDYEAGHV